MACISIQVQPGSTTCTNLVHTIAFSNNTPNIGETVACTATVTNTGSTTEKFHINFAANSGAPFYTDSVQTIAPGATISVPAAFQGTFAGTVNICADLVCDTTVTPTTGIPVLSI